MDRACVFCKIIAGELPSAKVYEDEDTLAFLDIAPVVKGHTLVIPKRHCNPITDTPPEVLAKTILTVRKIARAQVRALGADGLNVAQANGAVAGQVVPHIHFHVIPRFVRDGALPPWRPGEYGDRAEMNGFAERLRSAVETGL